MFDVAKVQQIFYTTKYFKNFLEKKLVGYPHGLPTKKQKPKTLYDKNLKTSFCFTENPAVDGLQFLC